MKKRGLRRKVIGGLLIFAVLVIVLTAFFVGYQYYTIGNIYLDLGENKKALEYISKAYDIYLAVNGEDNTDTQTVEQLLTHIKERIKNN